MAGRKWRILSGFLRPGGLASSGMRSTGKGRGWCLLRKTCVPASSVFFLRPGSGACFRKGRRLRLESFRPCGAGCCREGSRASGGGRALCSVEGDALSLQEQGFGISEPVQASADRAVSGGVGGSVRSQQIRKGSGRHEDEWRRLQIGFEAVFLKNRLTLHSLTNMGETDGMYKLENGRWSRTKDGLEHL